jgi:hypothetical protein
MKMRYKGYLKNLLLIIICILIFNYPVTISASMGGTGGGTGGGGGPSVPLYMTSSAPAGGAADVATNVSFILYYSHNVADVAIRSNNTSAISMADASGTPVQVNVSYPDDFARRQQVFVTPVGLRAYTTYVITIAPSFMARNGYTTGTVETITFTTGAQTVIQEESTQTANQNQTTGSNSQNTAVNNSIQANNSSGHDSGNTESNSIIDETSQVTDESIQSANSEESNALQEMQETKKNGHVSDLKPGKVYEEDENSSNGTIVIIIIAAVILVSGGTYIYLRKRKNGKI